MPPWSQSGTADESSQPERRRFVGLQGAHPLPFRLSESSERRGPARYERWSTEGGRARSRGGHDESSLQPPSSGGETTYRNRQKTARVSGCGHPADTQWYTLWYTLKLAQVLVGSGDRKSSRFTLQRQRFTLQRQVVPAGILPRGDRFCGPFFGQESGVISWSDQVRICRRSAAAPRRQVAPPLFLCLFVVCCFHGKFPDVQC